MTVLQVALADSADLTSPSSRYELSVNSVNPSVVLDDHINERLRLNLMHTGRFKVYRGNLTVDGKSLDVVCKVAHGDDDESALKAEAALYTTVLREAQGFQVPPFILYASGTDTADNRPVACMLTEYCGRPLIGHWIDNPVEERFQAFLALVKIHRLGIVHGDFRPSHIVVDELGRVRIIDFVNATEHECNVVDRQYAIYAREPPANEFRCQEVYDTSKNMDIWTPAFLSFEGVTIDMAKVKTWEDVARLGMETYRYTPADRIKYDAYLWMKDYSDRYAARRKEYYARLAEKQTATEPQRQSGQCRIVLRGQ